MDPFPWNSLPTEIQRYILSLLPVSTLIACTSVSTSLRSAIRSEKFTSSYKQKSAEAIFFFPDTCEAYNSSSDRWFSLPVTENSVEFSHGPSALALTQLETLLVFNPLRPNLNPKPIPPPPNGYVPFGFFTLPDSPTSHFMIVAIIYANPVRSQVYDSALGQWRSLGEIHNLFQYVESTVFMEDTGLLYCVSATSPECILTLDVTAASEWTILKLGMPAPTLLDLHLFGFSCRLFLAAAVERNGSTVGVCIWELDRAAMKWSLACSMPDEQFATFSAGNLSAFHMINCGRVVCFYNEWKNLGESMMMCDVLEKRWWRPRQCPFPTEGYILEAVEPCIDLVWGSN